MKRVMMLQMYPLAACLLCLMSGTKAELEDMETEREEEVGADMARDTNVDIGRDRGTDVIRRDVAIIGGGTSGVYAALRLRDYKKSVVVIEPQGRLGGHTETYITPTGTPIDYGVFIFSNTSIVRNYFARFNLPLEPFNETATFSTTIQYTDFSTGMKVNYTPPNREQILMALQRYKKVLLKYPSIRIGYKDLPYPVPEELLMPFGEFVRKYRVEAILPFFVPVYSGYAPLLKLPTLYILKYFSLLAVQNIKEGAVQPKRHNTQELYNAARKELGPDALLNSRVSALSRGPNGNFVFVNTPTGRKTICAKKILITAQPLRLNFDGLTKAETSLFRQFFANYYYTGILKDTGLPSNAQYRAVDPNSPGLYIVLPFQGTNRTVIVYGSTVARPVEQVKAIILNTIRQLQRANAVSTTATEFVAFADHSPYNSEVSVQAIKDHFYEKLFALQGRADTFYSGAAWETQGATPLWEYTEEYLLPIILRSLQSPQTST